MYKHMNLLNNNKVALAEIVRQICKILKKRLTGDKDDKFQRINQTENLQYK